MNIKKILMPWQYAGVTSIPANNAFFGYSTGTYPIMYASEISYPSGSVYYEDHRQTQPYQNIVKCDYCGQHNDTLKSLHCDYCGAPLSIRLGSHAPSLRSLIDRTT